MVVVGYGQIIPQVDHRYSAAAASSMCTLRCCRSIAARRRSSGPSRTARRVTGVTTMRIDAGLDTGDMLLKWETAIGPDETALELGRGWPRRARSCWSKRCAARSRTHSARAAGRRASHLRAHSEERGRPDRLELAGPRRSSIVRGLLPWPGAYSYFRGQLFHIWKARAAEADSGSAAGHAVRCRYAASAGRCGEGTSLELLEVQMEGRKRMPAEAFLNGQRLADNEVLGEATVESATWLSLLRRSTPASAKSSKDDLALIVSGLPAVRRRRVHAEPRAGRAGASWRAIICEVSRGIVGAILVNAGNANCATRTGDAVALNCCAGAGQAAATCRPNRSCPPPPA